MYPLYGTNKIINSNVDKPTNSSSIDLPIWITTFKEIQINYQEEVIGLSMHQRTRYDARPASTPVNDE